MINQRGYIALSMMMVLVEHWGNDDPVPLSEVCAPAGCSLSYAEQIIAGLLAHKLVKSYRGPGGGYRLLRNPAAVSVLDVLTAVEDLPAARRARDKGVKAIPKELDVFQGLLNKIMGHEMACITLKDIMYGEQKKSRAA